MTWRPTRRVMPDGTVVWVARYRDPITAKIRIAKPAWNGGRGTFKLRREAQRAIDEAVVEAAARRAPNRASTVEGYLDKWLRELPRSTRTDKTNEGRIRNVLELEIEGLRLGDWDLRELRPWHAYELVGLMLTEQKRAPGGVRDVLRSLSCMHSDAWKRHGLSDFNPWLGILVRDDDPRAVKAPREIRVWSFEQMHTFAAAASYRPKGRKGRKQPALRSAPEYTPMLRVMSDCGPRIGEVFAMKRNGLFLADAQLAVDGSAWEGTSIGSSDEKDHDRLLPLPPGCLELLRDMPPRIDTLVLFPTPNGKVWRYSNFKAQVWQPTCEAAGINPLPHEFRHSWNTHLRAAGIDPADLAQVAGHTVETSTKHYTHALGRSDDQIRGVIG